MLIKKTHFNFLSIFVFNFIFTSVVRVFWPVLFFLFKKTWLSFLKYEVFVSLRRRVSYIYLCLSKSLISRIFLKPNRFWFQKNDGQIVWILIQTHIRNTDSYSNTDSENLHISLTNQWLFLNVIKVSQRVAGNQIIDQKTSIQKSVILPTIQGLSPR